MVLENYGCPKKNMENPAEHRCVEEVCEIEGHVGPSPDALTKVPSMSIIINDKGEIIVTE